jgi:hypothetical protein
MPKVEQSGVVMPLWFGSGVHWALAQYYNPVLKRDPVEAFIWWWDIQMNGGILTEEQLDTDRLQVADPNPIQIDTGKERVWKPEDGYPLPEADVAYRFRGLYDLLPNNDFEKFDEHKELGIGMLSFYKEYAEANDNFAVIVEEHTFSIPVVDQDGVALLAMDQRDGRVKPVHIRGTQDALIQELEFGRFGILEHKTAARVDEDYFRKLEKDEQCTTYLYAAEREAALHGLEYEKVSFVLYNALRKAFPKPPTATRDGMFSINRAQESTTYPMLMDYIDSNGLRVVVDSLEENDKHFQYIKYVKESGDKQFIQRDFVRRNRAEIQSCGERIYMEVMDMLDPKLRIYPNPTGDYMCLNCPFRAPCIATDDGGDAKMLLVDNYEKAWKK